MDSGAFNGRLDANFSNSKINCSFVWNKANSPIMFIIYSAETKGVTSRFGARGHLDVKLNWNNDIYRR